MRAWLVSWLASHLGLAEEENVATGQTFSRLGLDSVYVTRLVADLSAELGRSVSPLLVWEHPTVDALALHLAGEGEEAPAAAPAKTAAGAGRTIEPVAVVGLACRFPGAPDVPAFWRLLEGGVDAVGEVPPDRWEVDAYYHPDPAHPGTVNTRQGGFLDRVDLFDPFFFGISPREAEQMDPQQRLVLELAWEALEDAGTPPGRLRGTSTGVFLGAMWKDYAELHQALGSPADSYTGVGQSLDIIANRVSYVLGLEGPSLVVDTACSSSLVAVHLACRSLENGECSVALAGGVNLMISPQTAVTVAKFGGGMAADGRCKAFDHRADGFTRGEGGGVVVLKALSRARRDGDRIYCLVAGSAVNSDGASNGLTAPNPRAQEKLLREACARAGLAPEQIDYVEAHGTGTPLGDPIEARALGSVLGRGRPAERPLLIGSVKTNLGHLESAAGVAGLIKTALSIHHRAVPPSLHFEKPNPHIPFADLGLAVASAATPWPATGEPARAGVSAFGWGGTNCHVVVEAQEVRASLLPLGAADAGDLEALARQVRDHLRSAGGAAAEAPALCLAAARELAGGGHRLAVTGRSREELGAGLDAFLGNTAFPGLTSGRVADSPPPLAFVFSPVGSQWCGMGRELLSEPAFRAACGRCDRLFSDRLGWSLVDEIARGEDGPRWHESTQVFTLIFTVQVALAALWRSWGIEPDVVVGHSLGEVAAAHVAGALSLEEAARVLWDYSRLAARAAGEGGMALVQLPADELRERLAENGNGLWIAGSNSPGATLVAGDEAPLERLLKELRPAEVFRARVRIEFAAHSPHMEPVLSELRDCLRGIDPRRVRVPLISTTSARLLEGPELTGEHWARNLRQPVLFASAIASLIGRGVRRFLQLDPHPVTARALAECLREERVEGAVLASLRRQEDARTVLLDSLGALYVGGREPRWRRLALPGTRPYDLPASWRSAAAATPETHGEATVFPLSARAPEALEDQARATAARLEEMEAAGDPATLEDLAATAALGRDHHEHRLALVAGSRRQLAGGLGRWLEGEEVPGLATGRVSGGGRPRLAFVFSGQGARSFANGLELRGREPVFRSALEDCDELLRPHTGWSVLDELAGGSEASAPSTALVQPVLFAVQVALTALWRSWGIEPDAVVGHSVGEVAAAWAAGVLDLDEAARMVAHRGRLMAAPECRGAMLAVELAGDEAEELCEPYGGRLVVAAANDPGSVVLSGEAAAVDEAEARLAERGVDSRRLAVAEAFHSPLMESAARGLGASLGELEPRPARLPIFSTVTGAAVAGEDMGLGYWLENVRRPVRFAEAAGVLADAGYRSFLEIGPQPVLARAVSRCLEGRGVDGTVLASLRAGRDDRSTLLESLAALHCLGQSVDWEGLHPGGGRLVRLPAYPFQRRRYWLGSGPPAAPSGAGIGAPGAALEEDSLEALCERQLDAFHDLVVRQLEALNPADDADLG